MYSIGCQQCRIFIEFLTLTDFATGEGLTLSIFPLVHNADPALAMIIETNMSIETNMIRVPGEDPYPAKNRFRMEVRLDSTSKKYQI